LAEGVISESAAAGIRGIAKPWIQKHIAKLWTKHPHLPFHIALLPGRDLALWGEERSFSRDLGANLQRIALVLARDIHGNGESNYSVTGTVPAATLGTIGAIVGDLREGRQKINGNFPKYVEAVTAGYAGDLITRSAKLDLFYRDREGGDNYFEMKSPKPNRGQCWEATERLLLVRALRRTHNGPVRALYAMTYNPYGEEKSSYSWYNALTELDLENEVLIGSEFWDFLGGPGTYDALLSLFSEIGAEAAAQT